MTRIEDFQREYMAYHQISRARQVRALKVLREFEDRLDGRDITEAEAEDFQGYLGDLLETGLHVNTVRNRANMLRPLFGWAYERGYIDADRYMRLKRVRNPRGSTSNSEPRPYSLAEVRKFYRQLDERYPRMHEERFQRMFKRWLKGTSKWGRFYRHGMNLQLRAITALALHCGLRANEIFQLTPDDLHYDNAYIVIRGKADPNTGRPKVRMVPFTDSAREAMRHWLDFRERFFRPSHQSTWVSLWAEARGKPMWPSRFSHLLSEAVGPGWELHRFRHTCATERLRAGTPLETVSKLLGHATLQQTMAYVKIVESDIERSLAATEDAFVDAIGEAWEDVSLPEAA